MDGSLRLGNSHQGLRLVLRGFVFGQVFLPDRALDLPDFLTGTWRLSASNTCTRKRCPKSKKAEA